jgi:DtxR family manganese transport transcriptional regulator
MSIHPLTGPFFSQKIVVAFLQHLGISEKTAKLDAEGIEHHVSPETLKAFQAVLDTKAAKLD